jgi:Xaa-Pro aminopeptidase
MEPDLSPLADRLEEEGLDGYLVDADSESSATQRYLSGFDAADPFVTLYAPPETAMLVGSMEYNRARQESRADEVRRWDDYDVRERIEEVGQEAARHDALAAFLAEFDAESVAVPRRFPVWAVDGLRERDVTVEPDTDDALEDVRATKTEEEVAWIRESQRANEAAMRTAESLVADATADDDGRLHHDGEVLTSERVKREVKATLLQHDCSPEDTIVACGPAGATPHDTGSGPLRADEPVIVDIFPKSDETGYYADMTRTFVNGEPPAPVEEWYDRTLEAMAAAFDEIEPGVTGEAVNDAVCDVYEDAGYATIRDDPTTDTGFVHSTGHGVGLEVHEDPRLGRFGEELEPGHVVTVEPGLYDPEVGGVRIEDLVVVTEDGFENLTEYPTRLVV